MECACNTSLKYMQHTFVNRVSSVYVRCSCLVMQVSVDVTSFMCLTSLSIYSDPWKSFMKFEIKKSHEMISSIPIRISPLSEWNYRSSAKPCNLAQMNLMNSTTKVMKGLC
jgi:hypothetical protein